jgi:putative redox protein
MLMPVILTWVKDQQYVVQDGKGHGIVVESKPDGVPAGFAPSQLLLAAAAGCMANHVLSILQKKRLPPAKLRVVADGERAAEHPRKFVSIHLMFEVQGVLPKETIDDVVRLAKDKYCSVLNTLGPGTSVTTESKIISL